jgi:hypothetical protein
MDALIHPAFAAFLARGTGGTKFVRRVLAPLATGDTLAEVRVNYTHLFAGALVGGAPDQIDVASNNAGDNTKVVTRFGIDSDDNLVEESGTLATQAHAGVTAFKRLNDLKLSAAATGTITASEDGATTKTYATIAASDAPTSAVFAAACAAGFCIPPIAPASFVVIGPASSDRSISSLTPNDSLGSASAMPNAVPNVLAAPPIMPPPNPRPTAISD